MTYARFAGFVRRAVCFGYLVDGAAYLLLLVQRHIDQDGAAPQEEGRGGSSPVFS